MRIRTNVIALAAPIAAAVMLGMAAAPAAAAVASPKLPAAPSASPAMLRNCFTPSCVSARR
jgi:hypothetical protein